MSTTATAANIYWERVLTHSWRNGCQFHMIIPSVLITALHAYNPLDHPERNEIEHESGLYHTSCCMCGANVAEKVAMVAFRILLAKEPLNVSQDFVLYKAAFMNCLICKTCAPASQASLKADHDMINGVIDQFQMVALELNKELFAVDMPLSLYFKCIMNRMRVFHSDLIKFFGALESSCMYCKKKRAQWVCSACHFNHYCNKKCMKLDWPAHKEECQWYKTMTLFFALPAEQGENKFLIKET